MRDCDVAEVHESDVGMTAECIVAVEKDIGTTENEVDAAGLLVTPAWVDIRTHFVGRVHWGPGCSPSS